MCTPSTTLADQTSVSVFFHSSLRPARLGFAVLVLAAAGLSACHATQAADEGVNWLTDGLSDLDDAVQRSLDRQ